MSEDQTTEHVWEQLRATRWSPPASAIACDERRSTYVFALEQAEQMYRSATTVGAATRPLLVFYGLSQAGRAIAASASSIDNNAWRLNGHGIKARRLDQDLPLVEIRTDESGDGSFVRLSELLDSPFWGKAPVPLNDLWNLLPENKRSPLLNSDAHGRTPLFVEHRDLLHTEPHPLATVHVWDFPSSVTDRGTKAALDEYLAGFPEARNYHGFVRKGMEPDSDPDFTRYYDRPGGGLRMHWRTHDGKPATDTERLALLATITRRYDGHYYLFPAVGSSTRSMHPLMAWWAVLYTLSMLARYQPAEWGSHINVDTSRYAVAIERVLKSAIRIVPRLIAEAIEQVAS